MSGNMQKINKIVIIINGKGGVGKDTFISFCFDILKEKNSDFYLRNISSVDCVKEAALHLGWDHDKNRKSRKFLNDLKLLATNYNDFPFIDMTKKIKEEMNYKCIIFVAVREPGEIEKLKDSVINSMNLQCKTVLISRIERDKINFENMADDYVFEYNYDYIISNNKSLDDLKKSSECFLKTIGVINE